jgi:hypothetical protein
MELDLGQDDQHVLVQRLVALIPPRGVHLTSFYYRGGDAGPVAEI